MKDYLPKSKKPSRLKRLLNEALEILESVGIPITELSERRLERMAMCFLAVAGVTKKWAEAKSITEQKGRKTRDIINYINSYFHENISSGSYDDIRRKDLKWLVLANLIVNTSDISKAATNDPTRGYGLEAEFAKVVRAFGTNEWLAKLNEYLQNKETLHTVLARTRELAKISVNLPSAITIELSEGEHNELQKRIIEEFLPRFAHDSQLLYIGDTANKILHLEKAMLADINFFELAHEKLPDIIAYDKSRNRLYLIEAVHSSGTMSEARVLELKQLANKCTAKIVFVTAFLKKQDFRKWVLHIAWETEVWIAESPDHLIHFDGEKYLSPY